MRRLLLATAAILVSLWLALDAARAPARSSPGRASDPLALPALAPRRSPRASVAIPPRRVVAGGWGEGAGQFGRRDGVEADAEGPLAFAVAGDELLILDQVNGRIQRFGRDGSPRGTVAIGSETARDVAVDPAGRLAVLDRDANEVTLYGTDGQPLATTAIEGGALEAAGDATGLFADHDGVHVERSHTETLRVLGPDGTVDPSRRVAPGRPSRDGSRRLQSAIVDAAAGRAVVRVFREEGLLAWQRPVTFARPIVHLLLLDSDAAGRVYLGAFVAREASQPPYELLEPAIMIVRLDGADGSLAGGLLLPAHTGPEEIAEELQVADDGTVYQMTIGPQGVEVVAHRMAD
jgi:hypothetical protein